MQRRLMISLFITVLQIGLYVMLIRMGWHLGTFLLGSPAMNMSESAGFIAFVNFSIWAFAILIATTNLIDGLANSRKWSLGLLVFAALGYLIYWGKGLTYTPWKTMLFLFSGISTIFSKFYIHRLITRMITPVKTLSIIVLSLLMLTRCTIPSQRETITRDSLSVSDAGGINNSFSGVWVNKKYLEKLRMTGSPRESQESVEASMIIVPVENSEPASIIWGFHEGTSGAFKQLAGQIEIYTQESDNPDFIVTLTPDGELQMGKNTFVRTSIQIEDEYPIAEEFLLAGKYTLGDMEIELTPARKIIGLDSLNYYSVPLDYNDAGMQVDQIELGTNGETTTYGFTFVANELVIYHLRCLEKDGDLCLEVEFGKEYLRFKKVVR